MNVGVGGLKTKTNELLKMPRGLVSEKKLPRGLPYLHLHYFTIQGRKMENQSGVKDKNKKA